MNEKLIPVLLLAAALILLLIWLLQRKNKGLPAGALIYDDLSEGSVRVRALTSKRFGISGKPDMIIRRGRELIPVEIKSGPARERPYPSHVMQLTAYCLLIEENYGTRPSYGVLRYRNRQFEVPFSDALVNTLLAQLDRMRSEDVEAGLPAKCARPQKCEHCGYSGICRENR